MERAVSSPDELRAQLRAAQEAFAGRRSVQEVVSAELAGEVYYGTSPDGAVLANVDGNGALLVVQIDSASVRSAHPERVGPAIVAAINSARGFAADVKEQRLGADYGAEPGW